MPMSPYVARLRAVLGTAMIQLPTAAVRCLDRSGRVLLVRLVDNDRWALPGGAIDPDEAPDSAAAREAREEAGVEVVVGEVIAVLGGPEFRTVYPNGDLLSYVAVLYDATVASGSPGPDGIETSAVGWFSAEEVDGLELETFASLVHERGLLVPGPP